MKNNPATKDVIVFLFTALNQEHDYREGQRVGCDLYLTKPQNPKDIVEKVNEYLNMKIDRQPNRSNAARRPVLFWEQLVRTVKKGNYRSHEEK